MRSHLFETIVCGLLCGLASIGAEAEAEAGIVVLLASTGALAFCFGRRWPGHVLRTGIILWLVPYLVHFVEFVASGEGSSPSCSTGGWVAFGLWSMFVLPWMLALWFLAGFGADRAESRTGSAH